MEKFIINYHTGITDDIEVYDLHAAKEIAKEGIAYTQEKITIESVDGEVLVTSSWFGVKPEEHDSVLEVIADGFYQIWSDELENL